MQFYTPYQYVKWGLIVGVIGLIPNIERLGLGLFAFGIALELINRKFPESKKDNDALEEGAR